MINNKDKRVVEPGWFTISVGGEQPGFSGQTDASTTETVLARLRMTGKEMEMK
jgi:beta-glucosidase